MNCMFLTKRDPMHTIRKAVSGSGERYLKMVNFPMNYAVLKTTKCVLHEISELPRKLFFIEN
ncbi:hypothetical protein T02_61 [Trichinella nativa]|uniref:Uncharacterized protein n=1 Tax=Trichinella nativa TaxID=6335 RepID=A0A0V1L1P0_9BILA|nr:hypothetical protein T06_9815 [Trichinella sp. T6]KRX74547.1 hypothetical protein T06_6874 [Trichinella sp. T6]KRZ53476.1 hypothetical protein T02_61 [Trichinella nativa]